ncbi:hypothetical protein Tco_0916464, partial [Tanacetum coccineum]
LHQYIGVHENKGEAGGEGYDDDDDDDDDDEEAEELDFGEFVV